MPVNPDAIKFPIHFSVEKLQYDLRVCEKEMWTSHFNTNQYSGDWNSISLRSATGSENDILSFANQQFKDTHLLSKCTYFQEVISWFQCEKEAVRLLRLEPNSEIKEHVDNETSYEDGFFRIHIPVQTNDQVQFFVNRQLVSMKMGDCWYANFQLPHSVKNNSNESRVHLIVDCKRNHWSDHFFAEAGFDTKAVARKNVLSNEVKQQVINELLRNPTPTNLALVASMRLEMESR